MEENRCELCGEILFNGEYDWMKITEIIQNARGDEAHLPSIYRHFPGKCSTQNDDLCAFVDVFDSLNK